MDGQQIERVRRFHRLVTQRVGALEETYLQRGRPLAEARLIFETGLSGADLRDLRKRLGLDSGYLSRLLRSLEAQGLLQVGRHADDGRIRRVSLTAAGQQELAAYDRLSDSLAANILAPLAETQRAQLVAAMAEIERLLGIDTIDIRVEPPDSDDAQTCLSAYFTELGQRFDSGFDPGRSNPASEQDMTPPAGYFLVARLDGVAVGCGALKCGAQGVGEIKRMWTAPSSRGQGVASRLLQALETLARTNGLAVLRLETNRTLHEAQALYRRSGYHEVPRFNDEPYAHHWFEKRL